MKDHLNKSPFVYYFILAEHHEPEVYPHDPPVYHYTYSVDDDYTGAQIYADEERDVDHTHGMYEV